MNTHRFGPFSFASPSHLAADTGRPDMSALSRAVAESLWEAAVTGTSPSPVSIEIPAREKTVFVTSLDLVPGDIEGLERSAAAYEELTASVSSQDSPRSSLTELFASCAIAHRRLADELAGLRAEADGVFSALDESGLPRGILSDPALFRGLSDPALQKVAADALTAAGALRVAWSDAEISFFDDLAPVREALGVPSW